ncbi:hypothetical protein [Noviherbaspirillum saxi]|uniref:Uncharacterized protein n=1 Tax=Noviherbaspirillum saxi TaxID=2320863 RepID=A0A3A3FH85_9BURK|nr:hypothetical protein [Noviherbaspirillum saxi]RJF91758.1 hypothetical protein D3871_24005 [Noviherbaspirillum saxi]
MSRLGYDRNSGFVYEGRQDPTYPVWPNPVLSQATVITGPLDFAKVPLSFDSSPWGLMFREDSYDPVSRIRRGRLFEKHGNSGWEPVTVDPHPAIGSDQHFAQKGQFRLSKDLSVFIEFTALLQQPNRGEGLSLAIGDQSAYSLWRILQTEVTAGKDVLVTLRAESAFGILPELDESRILPDSLSAVQTALSRVLDAAYKELPTSVVDQCRNAATVIVSRWMRQETNGNTQDEKDLGEWIKTVKAHFSKRPMALISALEVIRILHPRGKDNEAARLRLRPLSDTDAELAVHAIGFILREVGWTR